MTHSLISVVVPVYNEEKNIKTCLESILRQDYPKEKMECFIVDGISTDKTGEILAAYKEKYPDLIYILSNPGKSIPCAINLGIAHAKGDYIIRLDAHAEYEDNYISKCVEVLRRTGADNVGGAIETKARTKSGMLIAKVLSSRFGVGGSAFRTKGKDGYVDTVPFGAFRRELFDRIGGFDERLTRNEDNEFNYRIIKNGGKVYLCNEIKCSYYCRETLSDLIKMAFSNGIWNIITSRLYPGSMRLRHFVPCAFVLSLLILPCLGLFFKFFLYLLAAELMLYSLLDIIFSAKDSKSLSEFLHLIYIFPLFHISYGMGSVTGLLKSVIEPKNQ